MPIAARVGVGSDGYRGLTRVVFEITLGSVETPRIESWGKFCRAQCAPAGDVKQESKGAARERTAVTPAVRPHGSVPEYLLAPRSRNLETAAIEFTARTCGRDCGSLGPARCRQSSVGPCEEKVCSDLLSESLTVLHHLRSSSALTAPALAAVRFWARAGCRAAGCRPAGAAPQGCCEMQAVATAACPSPAVGWPRCAQQDVKVAMLSLLLVVTGNGEHMCCFLCCPFLGIGTPADACPLIPSWTCPVLK
ncbi:uncharacterized protein LOC128791559 [Vidua chalybeata]|uniref:uncharacterized protein LOC128791559 n=1 Tax=Vidua chalybeata TaxID=81927 RepID=UPI0023A869CE|nr:uncharacterized protein LOC128791559 [Vidua chalybeata]